MLQSKDLTENEKLFDSILKVALEETIDLEMESLPSSEELDKMFPRSAATDKRFMKIISTGFKKSKGKKAARILLRIVASFTVLFTIGIITLMSVEASRHFILNAIINIQNKYIAFDFGDAGQLGANDQAMFEFMPDDFEYISSQHLDNLSVWVYVSKTGDRILVQRHTGISLGVAVDNENRDFTVRQLGDYEACIFESSGYDYPHIILWAEGDYVFNMISTIDLSRMLDIVDDFLSRK